MSQKAQEKKVEEVAKNGATLKVVETSKTTENKEKVVNSVATIPNQEDVKKIPSKHSAEQRLKSAEQFQILGNKFRFLKEKEDELNNFILSSDGTNEKIQLSNVSGFKFVVTNTKTIEAVVTFLQNDLEEFIIKAEKEINDFVI